MIYGYIRVSSDKQTVENQRFEIIHFCEAQHLEIDGWIEETISGTKSVSKRQLGKLLRHVRKGDLIVCSELSLSWAKSLYDHGDSQYLYEQRMSGLDHQG